MQAHIVVHDEYWGTAHIRTVELAEGLGPKQVWREIYKQQIQDKHLPKRPSAACEEGYLENWDAVGPHHKGFITKIWWGEGSHEVARAEYDRLIRGGASTP